VLRKNHKTDDAGFVRWALLALALGGFGIGRMYHVLWRLPNRRQATPSPVTRWALW